MSIIKNRNVLLLMLGILGAELGMWFGLIGNLEFLQKQISSSFYQSLILVVGTFSGMLFGPVSGKFIDKYNKKNLLILAGIIRIIGAFLMLLALATNDLYWMLISMICIGLASSIYFPVINVISPLIVDSSKLIEINSFQMNIITIARIVGTALAGALLLLVSLEYLYVYSVILYFVLLISTFFLKFKDVDPNKNDNSDRSTQKMKFWDVLREIKSDSRVVSSLIVSIIPTIFISGFNIVVIEISKLQADASIKALLYSIEGSSIIITGLLVKKLIRKSKLINAILLSSALVSLSQLLLFIPQSKLVSIVAFFLFGIACGIYMPISSTLYQRSIKKEFLGRFFTFKRLIDTGVGQISLLLIGILLDKFGLAYSMFYLGIFSTILVITSFMKLRIGKGEPTSQRDSSTLIERR